MRTCCDPVIFSSTTIFIDLLDSSSSNFVLLAGCKCWCRNFNNTKVWAFFSQNIRIQFSANIRNIVTIIPLDHFFCIFSIRNKVIQNLIICKIHHIRLHTINLHITIRRSNCNTNRRCLCKIITGIIQFHAAWDTIQPQHHFLKLAIRKNIKFKLHKIIFTGGQFNTVLLTCQRDLLRLNIHTYAAIQTGECCCIIILYICGFENQLKILTKFFGIVTEQLIIDGCACACFNTEISVTITVNLISAISPVKIITNAHAGVSIGPKTIAVSIGFTCWVKIKCQICLYRLDCNTKILNRNRYPLFHSIANNFQNMISNIR